MAGRQAAQDEPHREGSRWIHTPPTGEEFAKWFKDTVKLHDGMPHEKYVSGITLIPGSEKHKTRDDSGRKTETYRDVFTPYAKVETRVAYFWDLCALKGWLGEIEPIIPKGALQEFKGIAVPDPFYFMPYPRDEAGNVGVRLACTMQVRVFDPATPGGFDGKGKPVLLPPAGTKVVTFGGEHQVARAETGAVGRALGMAGMLIIPGSGVATAEDMQELAAGPQATGEEATLETKIDEPSLAEQVAALRQELESDYPGVADELEEWAQGRKINLNEIQETQLRAVHKQMTKVLDAAKAAA